MVVAVPDAASLADAYEEVRAATGLALLGTPDGLHVAVLRGEWRGVPVDVQVWRGAEGCAAEAATARALRLSARLAAEADAAMVAGVRALHAWARAADAKGHLLCRLPGVAVTCAAVVLQSKGSLAVLLGALRDALVGRAAPALDFDAAVHLHADMTPERDANGRCVCPLRVLAERENVARRMTAGTTRHLLDCFAYASMLGAGAALCERARYDAWRAETMVVCAVARARCADVLPRLHAALSRLDGHPVVDAVHVREDGDALVVLATLDASASAAAYGFRAGDELVVDGDRASVTRRGRAWPLAITRGRAPRAAATPSVADLLAAGAGRRAQRAGSDRRRRRVLRRPRVGRGRGVSTRGLRRGRRCRGCARRGRAPPPTRARPRAARRGRGPRGRRRNRCRPGAWASVAQKNGAEGPCVCVCVCVRYSPTVTWSPPDAQLFMYSGSSMRW